MALTRCKECGNEISDSAAYCPRCGAPNTPERHCSKCGATLSSNLKFCPRCEEAVVLVSDKDRVAAGILCVFLGELGVHYFYMGKTTAGFLCILITVLSCGLWYIVMLVQAIMILCMSDTEFNTKYVHSPKTFPLF